jgi:RNA polymerase sigma factor (sigma-70 family)
MPDVSDMELLRDYDRQGSEDAFAALVRRHINLVYSVAFRHVGIAAHAEEITQAVFVILARKAASLRPDTILEGWLHETTRLTALSFLRGERRRQFREQEAYMQSTLQASAADSAWNQLAPLLDEAMSRLGKKDRDAVMLRFFKDKSLREVAAGLRASEAAAQRRVLRAVDKLRLFFTKRGVVLPAAVLTAAISANSVQAAPVALAKSVTALALAKGAAASTSTLTLIKGALKIMAWTKMKSAAVVGVAALLAVGTTTVVIHHRQTAPSTPAPMKGLSDSDDLKYVTMTPEQFTRALFEALGRGDGNEIKQMFPPLPPEVQSRLDRAMNTFTGLEIVSIGTPFTKASYAGVYVPYEIRFRDGSVKKWQLAIRRDNPAKRWYWDGGL